MKYFVKDSILDPIFNLKWLEFNFHKLHTESDDSEFDFYEYVYQNVLVSGQENRNVFAIFAHSRELSDEFILAEMASVNAVNATCNIHKLTIKNEDQPSNILPVFIEAKGIKIICNEGNVVEVYVEELEYEWQYKAIDGGSPKRMKIGPITAEITDNGGYLIKDGYDNINIKELEWFSPHKDPVYCVAPLNVIKDNDLDMNVFSPDPTNIFGTSVDKVMFFNLVEFRRYDRNPE